MFWFVIFCLANNTKIQPFRVTNEFLNNGDYHVKFMSNQYLALIQEFQEDSTFCPIVKFLIVINFALMLCRFRK